MKYIKTYEDINTQFREVDLQLLCDDILKYRKTLSTLEQTELYFYNNVLKPLLLNKNIEFRRAVSPIDGEAIYGFGGKVKEIIRDNSLTNMDRFIISLYNKEYKYILGDILYYNDTNKKLIVKIYDSEELEIEKEIDLIKSTNKYNL